MLCAFLVFAGLGSGVARPFALRVGSDRLAALIAIAGIAILAVADLLLLGALFRHLTALPLLAKLPISILAIAPLAFCMGMPFPLGLGRLQTEAPRLLPWAWGINGCASVVSTILASLLALHFGFSTVLLIAVALYALAALAYPVISGEGL
jgi:hypothetical protein